MTIQEISLENFRNYTQFCAQFDPNVNVIVGANAQGKTNLLEAIAYLSSAASHRARYDRELIRHDAGSARLRGSVTSRSRHLILEANLQRGARRQLWSNGVKLKTAGELSGLFNTILFCPEDLDLIREGAEARRRFLDSCISQLRPKYAEALAEYRRLREHKLSILKNSGEKPDLLDTLDDFSTQMAKWGAVLIHYRAHFIKRLRETAPAIHEACSGGERLELQYKTVSTVTDPEAPAKTLFVQLLEHQKLHRQAEIDSKSCLSGPHKDDLEVFLDGSPARIFASQGQTRTAALALKLAARDIFFQETGEWPVLLLDDVLSELDARRQEFVLNRITAGQVFITCCEEEKLALLSQGRALRISGGTLQ